MNNLAISVPAQAMPSAELNLGGTSTSEKAFITSATTGAKPPAGCIAIAGETSEGDGSSYARHDCPPSQGIQPTTTTPAHKTKMDFTVMTPP